MNEKHQHGGRAYHSVLEPHLDFIRELRQRRKTWKEIAGLLNSEKGIKVTLYAPYRFYRRKFTRSRPHWEDGTAAVESQVGHASKSINRTETRPAPLPALSSFKRPNREQFNPEEFT